MIDNKKMKREKTLVILSLLIPGLIFFVGGMLYPLSKSLYESFFNTVGFFKGEFIGFGNYQRLFQDKIFWTSIRNAILLGLGYIFISHPIAVVIGWNIRKLPTSREKLFRTILFIPGVISLVVLVKIWVFMYNPDFGPINNILSLFGLDFFTRNWLGDLKTALPSVIVMAIWIGWAYSFLYDYVSIKNLPEDVFEAAKIDGATGIKLHIHITLPLLLPMISIFLATAMINAFKLMEVVMLSTDGGPVNSTQFVANYMYIRGFRNFQLGYANTISVVFALICVVFTLLFFKLTKNDIVD